MKLYRPRPLSDFSPAGRRRFVNLAEQAIAVLADMNGDVEVRIGSPSFRFGLPASLLRAELARQIDEARATAAGLSL